MIVTVPKSLDEILDSISPYRRILVVGCDGCTQPPRGLREAETLGQLLELGGGPRGKDYELEAITTAKQCDSYLTAKALEPRVAGVEAILSLACGVGVQTLAELFPDIGVLPAQNTHFMGREDREGGTLEERCLGCGDCLLGPLGGVCPVTRCAKGLLNGACGGAKDSRCELDPTRDCAWELIYERLEKQGKLDNIREYRPPRNHQAKAWRLTS